MSYVVKQPSNDTYLKEWETVEVPTFVTDPNEAHEFETLQDAEDVATRINAGTLGVPKP